MLAGLGGASLIDSFLAIRESETANPQTLNAFPDQVVKTIMGSPFRAVDLRRESLGSLPFAFETRQSAFVEKHKQDMMVVTTTGTSVNHLVAQKRSLTGNGAWSGRTLQELVALEYGEGYLVPNVNMALMGYLEHGDDPSLPSHCYHEPVAQPAMWPLSLSGSRGIQGAPDSELVALARRVRDEQLDPGSPGSTSLPTHRAFPWPPMAWARHRMPSACASAFPTTRAIRWMPRLRWRSCCSSTACQ